MAGNLALADVSLRPRFSEDDITYQDPMVLRPQIVDAQQLLLQRPPRKLYSSAKAASPLIGTHKELHPVHDVPRTVVLHHKHLHQPLKHDLNIEMAVVAVDLLET